MVAVLKILIILSLNLYFVTEVQCGGTACTRGFEFGSLGALLRCGTLSLPPHLSVVGPGLPASSQLELWPLLGPSPPAKTPILQIALTGDNLHSVATSASGGT